MSCQECPKRLGCEVYYLNLRGISEEAYRKNFEEFENRNTQAWEMQVVLDLPQ